MRRGYVDFVTLLTGFHPRVVEAARAIGPGCSAIEIGGGANPALSPATCEDLQVSLTVLDISERELAKAPAAFRKIRADIASPDFVAGETHDLAFSTMVAEHVADAHLFHRNVRNLLKPGGVAVHLFPTLHTAPFVLNRIVPESVSSTLLRITQPNRDLSEHRKFPARYEWCRGPTQRQVRRLLGAGYEIEEFVAAFGHNYYNPIPVLRGVHAAKTEFLLKHPRPMLTSFAMVVLRRSVDTTADALAPA